MSLKIYGKLPSGERSKRIKLSPQYRHGSFQNLSVTNAMAEDASFIKTLKEFIHKPKEARPSSIIPSVKTQLSNLSGNNGPEVVWFGHSSYFLAVDGLNLLVDPVFSGNAAPVKFMVKAFEGADVYSVKDMPEIDILMLTHDHYDHLDYKTVQALRTKVKMVVCSLGVGSHLEHWGFPAKHIHELDWHESYSLQHITLTAAPARHFSGRGIKRGQTLWSSFVLQTKQHQLYLGGDSGYDSHFKELGKKYGSFDLAILESGQYNAFWPHIHMMPEQTVQACVDLNAQRLLPVHWGKFSLAMNPWTEPIERVLLKATELKVQVLTPKIGEVLSIQQPSQHSHWWRNL